jgi:Na+/proline symporter
MFEDSGILVVAMVFVIIALLAIAFALLVELKVVDFKFAGFVLLGAALFALLAGIFYFCACTGDYDGCDLGIGAVLCGLLSIFAAGGAGFVGCMKVLKK